MGLFEHFPYVNFHEKNIDWILRDIKKRDDDIADLQTRMTAAEGNITNLFTITTSLDGRVTICETDISGLKTRVNAAEDNITNLDGRVTNCETRITVNENDIANTASRLSTVAGNVSTLQTRVAAAETDIDALEAHEQIPAHTAADAGKVLKVTSSNTIAWQSEGASTAGVPLLIEVGSSVNIADVITAAASRPVYLIYTNAHTRSFIPLFAYGDADSTVGLFLEFIDQWGATDGYFTEQWPYSIEYKNNTWTAHEL